MRRLVLVRHSLPEIIPHLPASQWPLSDEGRRRCQGLARELGAYEPVAVIASLEPKASDTGRIVARNLGIPFETSPNLHEHDRRGVAFQGDEGQFRAQVANLFRNPGQRVFGNESADEAHRRFANAIAQVLDNHPAGNLIVASHGTVITLFVARATGLDPIPFWKSLDLPAFVVLSIPDFRLLNVVARLGAPATGPPGPSATQSGSAIPPRRKRRA